MWSALRGFIATYGLLAIPLALALWFAWGFVAPPPPRQLAMAVGQPGGVYWQVAERYRDSLARQGITLRLVETAGAVDNLRLLQEGQAVLGFGQGGAVPPEAVPDVVSLGAVFHEAVWPFRRDDAGIDRIGALRGRRVAIGPDGSGTRALALNLLAASGISPDEASLLAFGTAKAAEALAGGTVDAALYVSARPTEPIHRLLRTPGIDLIDVGDRAAAYVAAFPYLSAVSLPAGGVSLAEDLPRETVTMLAAAAQLAVVKDIHPQIVALMMDILAAVHRGRDLFSPPGAFPTDLLADLPLHPDAARWYRQGPSFLQRVAPFWVAVWIERMWVLLIPLLTLGLPLLRFAPGLLRWQGERRIYRWYRQLRAAEAALARSDADHARALAELDGLEARLTRLRVPNAYARQLYDLRAHLAMVRRRAGAPEEAAPSPTLPTCWPGG